MTSRPLVLCADDYGLNPGVSRAILTLARSGRISATSCMTTAPDWPRLAADLRDLGPGIGIGLHLTLTWGRPLGPMPGFAPDGRLPPLGAVIRRSLAGRLPGDAVRAEIERQLDAFEAALGRPPDFVDGHQHVHVLPGIRAALLESLRRRALAGRVWLRDPADRLGAVLARRLSAGKALLVGALAAGFRRDARRAGFSTNEGFSGFSPFDPAREVAPDMYAYLSRLGPRPLAMCHPGLPDPDGTDEIAAARLQEYAYLASPSFDEMLASRALVLVPGPR